jgi:hypothetical protein
MYVYFVKHTYVIGEFNTLKIWFPISLLLDSDSHSQNGRVHADQDH